MGLVEPCFCYYDSICKSSGFLFVVCFVVVVFYDFLCGLLLFCFFVFLLFLYNCISCCSVLRGLLFSVSFLSLFLSFFQNV